MTENLPTIQKNEMGVAVTNPTTIRRIFETQRSNLAAYLREIDFERYMQSFLVTASLSPKIYECTVESIMRCVIRGAEVDLPFSSNMGFLWPIPRRKSVKVNGKWEKVWECQLQIGSQGWKELYLRSPKIVRVWTGVAHEGDRFRIIRGTENRIEHEETPDSFSKPIIGAYACAQMVGSDEVVFKAAYWDEIDKNHRQRSDAFLYSETADKSRPGSGKKDSPWHTFPGEMCEKTMLTSLRKLLPLAPSRVVDRAMEIAHTDYASVFIPESTNGQRVSTQAEVPDNLDVATGELLSEDELAAREAEAAEMEKESK